MWLILLGAGLGLLGWGLGSFQVRPWDDIPRIATLASGGILLLWGFLLTPSGVQLGIEALAMVLALGLHRLSARLL